MEEVEQPVSNRCGGCARRQYHAKGGINEWKRVRGEDATTTLTINTEEIIKNFNYIRLQYSFSITREED